MKEAITGSNMADRILQRVVIPPERGLARLYYRIRRSPTGRRPVPCKRGRRGIGLPRGTVLRTNTWFNGFFERFWREYTRLDRLVLRVRTSAGDLYDLHHVLEQLPDYLRISVLCAGV